MPNVKYSQEQRLRALELFNSGRKVEDISKELKIPKYTLYFWNTGEQRQRFAHLLKATQAAKASAPAAPAPTVPGKDPEMVRLLRENDLLRKMLAFYRAELGVDI